MATQVPPVKAVPTQTPTKPNVPGPAKLSVSAGVSQANSKAIAAKRHSVILGDTNDLGDEWFHAMLYGPTSCRKTTTAALFGSPEDVRIILTRRKEQMRPLRRKGYKYALIDNATDLGSVITHPESFWPDPTWTQNPNRTLIVDDLTEGVALLVDSSTVIDGKEVKDPRRSYNVAGQDLRQWLRTAMKAPQHLILVALEKTILTPAGESIFPDLPPSMKGMVTTELEYVFYIKTGLWRLLVERKKEQFEKIIEGRNETLVREIFAKNKQEFDPKKPFTGNGIFGMDEPMGLRDIWRKITAANIPQAKVAGK
jgi:hypothetical protein